MAEQSTLTVAELQRSGPIGPRVLRCNLCGKEWRQFEAPVPCDHSDEEWQKHGSSARWTIVAPPQ